MQKKKIKNCTIKIYAKIDKIMNWSNHLTQWFLIHFCWLHIDFQNTYNYAMVLAHIRTSDRVIVDAHYWMPEQQGCRKWPNKSGLDHCYSICSNRQMKFEYWSFSFKFIILGYPRIKYLILSLFNQCFILFSYQSRKIS